jgi:WD40 repeat protein
MGIVYRARQISLNRPVALKRILAGQLASETDVRRFCLEAEAAANLDHPGIVPIYEVGQHKGQHYFSMGFVEGQSLAQKVAAGPLPPREAAALMREVAEAVQFAHEHGVIHRDLKPANVLLDAQGRPRVTDFGLAKKLQADSGLTSTGQVMGTPSYMPPEQASGTGDGIGTAADVYSLGASLYCLMTGRPPFQASSIMDTLIQVLEREPVSPRQLNGEVSRDLETICLKCLEKDPKRRYASAQALAEDLGRHLSGEPISARPISAAERTVKWVRRRPAIAGLTAAVFVVAMVGGAGVLWQWRSAVDNARIARDNERTAKRNEEAAKAAQKDAQYQRDQLAIALKTSRRDGYFTDLTLAKREWEIANIEQVEQLLGKYGPRSRDGAELRGFEWSYLRRLCHLELRRFRGHDGPVFGVAFAPGGARLATAGGDGTVRLWDTETGQESLVLKGHRFASGVAFAPAFGVAFAPDGERLASGDGDGTVWLWDAKTGREVLGLKGHQGLVQTVAFAPSGEILASAGQDGAVRVWDAVSGREVRALQGHKGLVQGVAFAPDGARLASGGSDSTVRIWDTRTGDEVFVLRGHRRMVLGVAFAPDGARLATTGGDGTVRIWDTATGREARVLEGHQTGAWGVAFSGDGRLIASSGEDGTVRIWDARTGRETRVLTGHQRMVPGVAFAPDGTQLASAGTDGTVRLWGIGTGREALVLEGHQGIVCDLEFAPVGTRLASAGTDGTVR